MASSTFINLANGFKMPVLGLGTWMSKPNEVKTAVEKAIEVGYRHIDTALVYGNESEIGEAVEKEISDGTVKREDLFIVTKLWNVFHRKEDVVPSLRNQLKSLRLDYVDLFLIHSPMALQEGGDLFPKDADGKLIYSKEVKDCLTPWQGMEECQRLGLARSIGLSNFNIEQTQRVLDNCQIKPVVLQIELSPYLIQTEVVQFCKEKDIVVTAYSPLGNPSMPWKTGDEPKLLEDPRFDSLIKKYEKTAAQLILKWILQRGITVIPKSITPARIVSNSELFDFEMSQEDMDVISGFNNNLRFCHFDWLKDHPNYPFHE